MKHFFCVLVVLLVSCGGRKEQGIQFKKDMQLQHQKGYALGTSYSILYFSSSEIAGVKKSLDSIFFAVNKSMSTYIPTSDISKINKGDTSVKVDQMFKEVFELSNQVYSNTQGYFDPTVGILVNAWGFGPQKTIKKINKSKIDSLMQYVGFDKVKLKSDLTVKKTHPNVYLDFNAIAKGYCVDRVAAFLNANKIENYLIEIGGELVAKGYHVTKQKLWTVGIDDPKQKESRTLIATLKLQDRAMATSGNYRKFRVDSITGKKYVHTIDAFTGYAKASNILSVSVLGPNCAIADAYATAFMAMPLQKIKEFSFQNKELEVYVVYVAKDGVVNKFTTDGFKKTLN